jgi:hypothetical protein
MKERSKGKEGGWCVGGETAQVNCLEKTLEQQGTHKVITATSGKVG